MSDLDLKERLRGMVSSDGAAIVCKDRTTREMTRDITEAADRIAALEDALRPFADKIDLIDAEADDAESPDWTPFIPVGAYRNAARVLKRDA